MKMLLLVACRIDIGVHQVMKYESVLDMHGMQCVCLLTGPNACVSHHVQRVCLQLLELQHQLVPYHDHSLNDSRSDTES